MLIAAFKDKKRLPWRCERKSAFQTIVLGLHKQPKAKRKKEYTRLVIVTIWADMVAKTDDEVYVLSLIKFYS